MTREGLSSYGRLIPMSWTVLREGLSAGQIARDVGAGVIVGIVALPLAIAFGIASGVKPEQGLYTAIVAGFLISLLGGSRVQIGGPTGAFIVLVYGVVQQYGYEGLALATMMAGALLILMGVARLGSVIKFMPYPVTVGFTAGIALIIAASQIRDFLGLDTGELPADFIDKVRLCAERLETTDAVEPGPRVALGARDGLLAAHLAPRARAAGGRAGDDGPGARARSPGRDDRRPLRRRADRAAAPALPAFDLESLRELFPAALAIATAGRDRVAALGGRRRRHDQRPPPLEHGAGGPGGRQHRLADLRRDPGHRRHRAHGDQRQERRPHARWRGWSTP